MSEMNQTIESPEQPQESRLDTVQHKTFISRFLKPQVLGLIAGALGGYLYYVEIGCKSGSCAITSNPWLTVLWGAIMGYLIGDMFRPKSKG